MDARFYNSDEIDIERLAQDLVNIYAAQSYNAQNIGTKDQMLVQLKKGGDFEAIIGMQAALTVTLQRTAGGVLAMIGHQKWIDKAAVGAIGIVALPFLWPLAITAGVGALRQASLGNQVLNVVDGLARQQRPNIIAGPVPVQIMPQVQQQWAPPPYSATPVYVPPPQIVNSQPIPQALPAPSPAPTPSRLRCPNCNTPYEAGDTFCTGCGRSLTPQKTYCANCHAELKPGISFCANCGASTFQSQSAGKATPPPPPVQPTPTVTYTPPQAAVSQASQTPAYTPPVQPAPLYTPPTQPTPVYTPPPAPKVEPYQAPPAPRPVARPKPPTYVPPTTQDPAVQPQPKVTIVPASTSQEQATLTPPPPTPEKTYYTPPSSVAPTIQVQPSTPQYTPASEQPTVVEATPAAPQVYYTPPSDLPTVADAPFYAPPSDQPTIADSNAAKPATASQAPWGTLTFSNGQEMQLSGERAVIGRYDHDLGGIKPEIDLAGIQGADAVSRVHAALEKSGNAYTLTDLNSTNATRVNGKRLEPDKPTPINDGDTLLFGKVQVTFKKI